MLKFYTQPKKSRKGLHVYFSLNGELFHAYYKKLSDRCRFAVFMVKSSNETMDVSQFEDTLGIYVRGVYDRPYNEDWLYKLIDEFAGRY